MVQKNKEVTYKHLKIGQEINGYRVSNTYRLFRAYVKAINPNYVTVSLWDISGTEEKINSSAIFQVEMTEEEFENKYRENAKEVIKGIQNKLLYDEIGYHENWNSWLYGTPYEIASYCIEEKMKIVGYCTDITTKYAMFSEDMLDAGVCAEYEDGTRIWCHYRSEDIKSMIERYPELS